MNKLTVFLILSVFFYSKSHGQFNPVNNLNWKHWYDSPHNYFILTWTPPTTSQDTLIGYNIYRNNELYRFQTDTILNHEPIIIGNCPENFIFFNNGIAFSIYVIAVYNSDSSESNYNDSVYCNGYAISVNEIYHNKKIIYPNPTSGNLFINIPDVTMLILTDTKGKIIKNTYDNSNLDLNNFSNGLYLLKILTINREYNFKIIINK